jgi:DNA invertase Pin-like site-specific DNA recombinase
MLIGYARVSTQDQSLDLQREALTKAGCQKIFEDKISGSRAERLGLAKTMEMLREGDTLVVWKLDRLAAASSILWISPVTWPNKASISEVLLILLILVHHRGDPSFT